MFQVHLAKKKSCNMAYNAFFQPFIDSLTKEVAVDCSIRSIKAHFNYFVFFMPRVLILNFASVKFSIICLAINMPEIFWPGLPFFLGLALNANY